MGQLKSKINFIKELCCYQEVIENGSFSQTAKRNGYRPSNLSAIIKKLEARFGAKLFDRGAKGLIPTALGQTVMEILGQTDLLYEQIYYQYCKIKEESSRLRVWVEDGFANCYTCECLKYLSGAYPQMHVDLLSNPPQSNNLNGIDLAFVHDKNPMINFGEEFVRCRFSSHFWCSKEYIERYGRPKDMNDLLENHRICVKKESLLWMNTKDVLSKSKYWFMTAETASLIVRMVKDGYAVGLMPSWMGTRAADNSDLVSLKNLGFCIPHYIVGVINPNVLRTDNFNKILAEVKENIKKLE